jgi:hypothetical protein
MWSEPTPAVTASFRFLAFSKTSAVAYPGYIPDVSYVIKRKAIEKTNVERGGDEN